MKRFSGAVLALLLIASAAPALAQDCSTKTASAPRDAGTTPAAVGNDGTAATGWTGAAGGNNAGIEAQKQQTQTPKIPGELSQPEEAKGLDLKGTAPSKC